MNSYKFYFIFLNCFSIRSRLDKQLCENVNKMFSVLSFHTTQALMVKLRVVNQKVTGLIPDYGDFSKLLFEID